ncbi:hypothetical protein GWI33_014237 [Rhynchophorus ferrugineus]|uniref:Uncharacterized protein n=1 Tax=Rhynchophorus ferrugineus TaxID=354439 RepID=A0A834I4W2_RHYFE|nr:hypothetical protein GWI33_014237 [Rhynchophorus ferrugineus]
MSTEDGEHSGSPKETYFMAGILLYYGRDAILRSVVMATDLPALPIREEKQRIRLSFLLEEHGRAKLRNIIKVVRFRSSDSEREKNLVGRVVIKN